MKNNLIFNNCASFALCPVDALDAPRMPGWRQWHVTATNADAVAALESGLVGREYETTTGWDEEGNFVTELMQEDLSAYMVPGVVCDHMDGTVTIFARQRTELERTSAACAALGVDASDPASADERLAEIQSLAAHANMTGEDKAIVSMPVAYATPWEDGLRFGIGRLLSYKGIKYLTMQEATAQAHYPPDMPNGAMLSIYKPYQGKHGYDWLYGEYIEKGFTRYENGVLYRCYQDPNANIFPPSQTPNCWEVVD